MKKIIIPLIIIVPAVLFWMMKKTAEESKEERSSKKDRAKSKGSEAKIVNKSAAKNIREKTSREPETKVSANSRCKGVTSSGKKCSRVSLPDSEYCWQHAS